MDTSVDFGFPGTPYKVQTEFMRTAYAGITEGGLIVLESPTGSGKSLSLLCSALAWLRDYRVSAVSSRLDDGGEVEDDDVPAWVADQVRIGKSNAAADVVAKWISERKQIRTEASSLGVLGSSGKPLSGGVKRRGPGAVDGVKQEDQSSLLWNPVIDAGSDAIPNDHESSKTRRVQVIICSRTHSQLAQLVKEMRRIPANDDFNIITLGSREQLCVHPAVRNSTSGVINDLCRKLVDDDACEFRKSSSSLSRYLLAKPLDIEEMRACGKSENTSGCPYYAVRFAVEDADIIFVPYASVLHTKTRESLGIVLKDSVVIMDEAHNILETVNSVRSVSFTEEEGNALLGTLTKYLEMYTNRLAPRNHVMIKQFHFVVKRMVVYMRSGAAPSLSVQDFLLESKLGEVNMGDLSRVLNDGQFARKLRGYGESCGYSNSNAVYALSGFIGALQTASESDRIIVRAETNSCRLCFAAIDAESELAGIVNLARAVLLVGGTMQPLDDIIAVARLAECKISTFSGSHIFDLNRVFARVISHSRSGEKLAFTRDNRLDAAHTGAIREVLNVVFSSLSHGGIVVFLPSYEYAAVVRSGIQSLCESHNVPLFDDSGKEKADGILRRYTASISERGRAALLSVVNGSLSEGIDFKDELCRCVLLVGMPYANIGDITLQERMKFYDRRHDEMPEFPGGRAFYEGRCMKAVNQTVGRAIRHTGDWSAIFLVDSRYNSHRVQTSLTPWVRDSLSESPSWETLESDFGQYCRTWESKNSGSCLSYSSPHTLHLGFLGRKCSKHHGTS